MQPYNQNLIISFFFSVRLFVVIGNNDLEKGGNWRLLLGCEIYGIEYIEGGVRNPIICHFEMVIESPFGSNDDYMPMIEIDKVFAYGEYSADDNWS